MTCQPDHPCGNVLRFFDATDVTRIYSCLNGHHILVGVPPSLAPSKLTGPAAKDAPCRYCHRLITQRRKGQVVHPECKSEHRRALWRKRKITPAQALAHDIAIGVLG